MSSLCSSRPLASAILYWVLTRILLECPVVALCCGKTCSFGSVGLASYYVPAVHRWCRCLVSQLKALDQCLGDS